MDDGERQWTAGPGRRRPAAALALALVLATGLPAGCGAADEPAEQGGPATTTAAEPSTTTEALPPPEGPLDRFVAERIGDLELELHEGAPLVRETGAEDARGLTYGSADGPGAAVTLSLWPSEQRARSYGRRFAEVLESDQGFEPRGGAGSIAGPRGDGILLRLDDGAGTVAVIWTSGRLTVDVLADEQAARTLLAEAPFGRGPGPGGSG